MRSVGKKRGLSISRYGTSNPVNSLLDGKNANIPNIDRQFVDNSLKNIFHEISSKSFSKGFLLILKFSENSQRIL